MQNEIRVVNPSRPGMPATVERAVMLLYVTLVMGALRNILENLRYTGGPDMFVLCIMITALAIMWLVVHMIERGKNWARFIVAVLTGFGCPLTMSYATFDSFPGILGFGQLILQIIALVFLFQKTSSDWFRQMNANGPQPELHQ
jgi:hypothetical protein